MKMNKTILFIFIILILVIDSRGQDNSFEKIYNGHDLTVALKEVEDNFGITISYVEDAIEGVVISMGSEFVFATI